MKKTNLLQDALEQQIQDLLAPYPDPMGRTDFRKACRIGTRTSLYLLQSGLVPCENTGKQTRCYKIAKADVAAYRLSLYIFALASFIEILLSGDFKEENICCARDEIESMSAAYRDIFGQCSVYLEKLSDTSLEANLLKGLGTASKAVGKAIERIPVVSQGPVDEFLQGSGQQMRENVVQLEKKTVKAFAKLSNPGVGVFAEKMNDLIQIYGKTNEICFDDKKIYLVAG
ncbi:MAG: hypothetical protein ACLSWR_03475 [Ruthenibacterium sp.]